MFDFFGRVICQHCKSRMNLETIQRKGELAQAIFQCSNLSCYEKMAANWKRPRVVSYIRSDIAA